jgi:DNA-binding NarL/FixJ family response regulator
VPEIWPVRVTQRDCELLTLMAEGLSNAEIAERAAVDVSDVQQQVATLSAKLGAHSKLEALSMACRRGLLSQFDG